MIVPGLSQRCVFGGWKPQHECLLTFLRGSQTHGCERCGCHPTSSLTSLCFPPRRCPGCSGNRLSPRPTASNKGRHPVVLSGFPFSTSPYSAPRRGHSPRNGCRLSLRPLPCPAAPAPCHCPRGLVAVPCLLTLSLPRLSLAPALSRSPHPIRGLISTPLSTALESTESAEPPRRPPFPRRGCWGHSAQSHLPLRACEQGT